MAPHVLAIDTAGHACSVALVTENGLPVFQQTQWISRGHAAALPPIVHTALGAVPPSDISALIVTRGPGGFTGMRAGLAFARAFGLARSIPTYGIDCFTALRLRVGGETPSFIDTRRGDFFYDGITGRLLNLPLTPKDSVGILAQNQLAQISTQPAGSIWQTQAAQTLGYERPGDPGWIEPCPIAMGRHAFDLLHNRVAPNTDNLAPLYVRAPSLG